MGPPPNPTNPARRGRFPASTPAPSGGGRGGGGNGSGNGSGKGSGGGRGRGSGGTVSSVSSGNVVSGNVSGNVRGTSSGNVSGTSGGNVSGTSSGNMRGNVSGATDPQQQLIAHLANATAPAVAPEARLAALRAIGAACQTSGGPSPSGQALLGGGRFLRVQGALVQLVNDQNPAIRAAAPAVLGTAAAAVVHIDAAAAATATPPLDPHSGNQTVSAGTGAAAAAAKTGSSLFFDWITAKIGERLRPGPGGVVGPHRYCSPRPGVPCTSRQ